MQIFVNSPSQLRVRRLHKPTRLHQNTTRRCQNACAATACKLTRTPHAHCVGSRVSAHVCYHAVCLLARPRVYARGLVCARGHFLAVAHRPPDECFKIAYPKHKGDCMRRKYPDKLSRKLGKKTCKQSQSYLRFLGLVQERTSSSPAYDRKTRQNRKNLEERMIRSAVMEATTPNLVRRLIAPCRAFHTPTHAHTKRFKKSHVGSSAWRHPAKARTRGPWSR